MSRMSTDLRVPFSSSRHQRRSTVSDLMLQHMSEILTMHRRSFAPRYSIGEDLEQLGDFMRRRRRIRVALNVATTLLLIVMLALIVIGSAEYVVDKNTSYWVFVSADVWAGGLPKTSHNISSEPKDNPLNRPINAHLQYLVVGVLTIMIVSNMVILIVIVAFDREIWQALHRAIAISYFISLLLVFVYEVIYGSCPWLDVGSVKGKSSMISCNVITWYLASVLVVPAIALSMLDFCYTSCTTDAFL